MTHWLTAFCALALLLSAGGEHRAPPAEQNASTRAASETGEAKTAALRTSMERQLETIASALDGVMGYSVVDLTTGYRFGRLQDAVFPTASSIKLAILYELFRQADEGKVKLDEPRTLERRHVVGGTGILRELTVPAMSLGDYATLMIVLSDNTATNALIDVLGMQKVTERMASLGLAQTRLRRRMIDLDAARRGDENVSTPGEIARLLEIIERGEGLSKESGQHLLAILKKGKTTPLTRGVPAGIAVAGKPGTLEAVAVDAGIVYVEGRPYVLSVMTTYLKNDDAGAAAIEQVSRIAFDYFNRLARSSDYGRRIR